MTWLNRTGETWGSDHLLNSLSTNPLCLRLSLHRHFQRHQVSSIPQTFGDSTVQTGWACSFPHGKLGTRLPWIKDTTSHPSAYGFPRCGSRVFSLSPLCSPRWASKLLFLPGPADRSVFFKPCSSLGSWNTAVLVLSLSCCLCLPTVRARGRVPQDYRQSLRLLPIISSRVMVLNSISSLVTPKFTSLAVASSCLSRY